VPDGSVTRLVRTTDRPDGVRVVTVTGPVDVFNAGELSRDAVAGLPREAREVVIDLESVSALDSGGLSAIVKLVRELRSQAIPARASIGADSTLSTTMVDLLRQVVPFDASDATDTSGG
jgi:ABC-type transporter Mla MlaB component